MSRSSSTSGFVGRRRATARLSPAAAELNAALAAHRIAAPQISKLIRFAAPRPDTNHVSSLARALAKLYLFDPLGDAGRYFLVGMPGIGKTLAAAKLAARTQARGGTARLVACDAARTGGTEQLRQFATSLGIELELAPGAAALAALRQRLGTMVLIDSPGINPFSPSERRALEALVAAAKAEPVLVLGASGDPTDTVEMAHVFRDLGCQRFIVTRLDIVQRLGGVMAVPDALGIAFAEGVSAPSLDRGIEPFSPADLAARLLCRN